MATELWGSQADIEAEKARVKAAEAKMPRGPHDPRQGVRAPLVGSVGSVGHGEVPYKESDVPAKVTAKYNLDKLVADKKPAG